MSLMRPEIRCITVSVCAVIVSFLLITLSTQSVFGESQSLRVTSFTDYGNAYRLTVQGSGAVPDTRISIRAFDPSGEFSGDFGANVDLNGNFAIKKIDINAIQGTWHFKLRDYESKPFGEITLKLPEVEIIDSTSKVEPLKSENEKSENEKSENEKSEIFPEWIKNIFIWYGQDLVSDIELKNALEYLINAGILDVSSTSGPSGPTGPSSIP